MSQKQVDNKQTKPIGNAVKKAIGAIVPTLACAAAILYISTVYSSDVALCASVNGNSVGYVRSTTTFSNSDAKLKATLGKATDGSYEADINVTYTLKHISDPEYISETEADEMLWSEVEEDFTEAYMLYVDGRQAAAGTSEAELNSLVEEIKADLLASSDIPFGGIKISSDLRIEKQLCLKEMVKPISEINDLINPLKDAAASDSKSIDDAEERDGNIVARISALTFSAPEAELIRTEADTDEADSSDFTLDYNFVNTVTLNEIIHFETKYIDDPERFIGNEKLIQKGSDGAKTVTYEILYDASGNIVGRNAVSENIITPATDKIISRGTAEIPDAVPTGSLIWPCDQPMGISSYYGWRELFGRPDFHLGIDIPDSIGSPIWAADGGEVIATGYVGSYGNCVHVQHNDGVSTLYAHLDTISVAVGDKLYKGQQLGTMGRTGVASGIHLHFEVRIDNQTTNPLNHLPEN